jgi:hypothetical protein
VERSVALGDEIAVSIPTLPSCKPPMAEFISLYVSTLLHQARGDERKLADKLRPSGLSLRAPAAGEQYASISTCPDALVAGVVRSPAQSKTGFRRKTQSAASQPHSPNPDAKPKEPWECRRVDTVSFPLRRRPGV